jgi:hypothetical protein
MHACVDPLFRILNGFLRPHEWRYMTEEQREAILQEQQQAILEAEA